VPEFARALLTGVFLIAVATVIVIWLIGHASRLSWTRRSTSPRVSFTNLSPEHKMG
jgi:hypothetical protein